MAFIRTIFIILIIFYIINLFFRYIVPFLIRRQIRKYTQEEQQRKTKKTGTITIDKNYSSSKREYYDDSEYVDYEEVND